MTEQLRAALTKRDRVWGQHNAAVLKLVRDGKAPSRPLSFRYRVGSPNSGCYVTRIPAAA